MRISLICTLSLCLLLQSARALPLAKRESGDVAVAQKPAVALDKTDSASEILEESTDDLDPRGRLVAVTVLKLTAFAKLALDDGAELLKGVSKKLNALPDKSEALQANITRIDKFLNSYKKVELTDNIESMLKVLEELVEFTDIVNDYEEIPDQQLKLAFEGSGYAVFESRFEEHVGEFASDFIKSFNYYVESLSEKEKKNVKNAKLIAWFDKFKAEKNIEKKVKIFGEFFDNIS